MATKLYVGNLAYGISDNELRDLFAPHGNVLSAQVIMDRETGRSKGFGFVEMSTAEEARSAISSINGREINGRSLNVNEARPREERSGGPRGGGGGSRGGFGGGGGGRRY